MTHKAKLERLLKAIEWLIYSGKASNRRDLALRLGYTESSLSQILNGRVNLSDRFINNLSNFEPSLNREWLLKGEGTMLPEAEQNEARVIDNPTIMSVPLVSKYAYGGYLGGYGDDIYMEALPTVPFILPESRVPRGEYIAFEVRGDSMDDDSGNSIKEGDILLCRLVRQDLWCDSKLHIRHWHFVIVHNDGIMIKQVINHNIEAHTITIHSLNPMYKDEMVDLRQVQQIFNVVQLLRKPRL